MRNQSIREIMPPKAVRKTPIGSGSKRGGRTARGTPKSQAKTELKTEEVVEEKPELKTVEPEPKEKTVEPVAEDRAETEMEAKSVENGAVSEKSKYLF